MTRKNTIENSDKTNWMMIVILIVFIIDFLVQFLFIYLGIEASPQQRDFPQLHLLIGYIVFYIVFLLLWVYVIISAITLESTAKISEWWKRISTLRARTFVAVFAISFYQFVFLISLIMFLKDGSDIFWKEISSLNFLMIFFLLLILMQWKESNVQYKKPNLSFYNASINYASAFFMLIPLTFYILTIISEEGILRLFRAAIGDEPALNTGMIIVCIVLIFFGSLLVGVGNQKSYPVESGDKIDAIEDNLGSYFGLFYVAILLFFLMVCLAYLWFFLSGSLLMIHIFLPLEFAGIIWAWHSARKKNEFYRSLLSQGEHSVVDTT